MALTAFTSNFEHNSTDAGFQFTFFCDICREGYKTEFTEAKSYKKGRFLRGLGGFASAATQVTGKFGNLGYGLQQGSSVLSEKFQGMSPEWHKEHESVFALAQNEAMGHFHRCPRCKKYVCDNDWNEKRDYAGHGGAGGQYRWQADQSHPKWSEEGQVETSLRCADYFAGRCIPDWIPLLHLEPECLVN